MLVFQHNRILLLDLTVPVVKKLIMEEKPDSILPTLGGQNALNIAMALADEGFLEEHNQYHLTYKQVLQQLDNQFFLQILMHH